jgi:uncharacterized protein (TIGR02246 family)/steroid delta-isomerase-like uncharacterized protein
MLTPETMHRELIGTYNRRDFAAMKSLLDEDYVYVSGDGKAARGIEAGLQNAYLYATAFPDAIIEVARVFPFGNTAVAELVARGTHLGNLHGIPPTKRKVEIVMCNVMELRDGKIHREREYFDRLAMLEQIGIAPEPQASPVTGPRPSPSVAHVEERVRAAIATFEAGWNRHDMDAMFEAFTPDAEWVNVVGMWWRGLAEIKRAHGVYHDTFFANTPLHLEQLRVRLVGDATAIAIVEWKKGPFLPPDGRLRPPSRDIMSFVFVERDGRWLIAGGHNTTIDEEALKFNPVA